MPDCNGDTLAKLFEVTKHHIQELARNKRVVKLGRDRYDFYPSVTSYLRYLKTLEKSEHNKAVKVNRQIKELALKKKEGELVDAEDMKRVIKAAFNTVKQGIRAIPPKCAQKVAALKVGKKKQRELIAEVEELLSRECDQALEALSKHKD